MRNAGRLRLSINRATCNRYAGASAPEIANRTARGAPGAASCAAVWDKVTTAGWLAYHCLAKFALSAWATTGPAGVPWAKSSEAPSKAPRRNTTEGVATGFAAAIEASAPSKTAHPSFTLMSILQFIFSLWPDLRVPQGFKLVLFTVLRGSDSRSEVDFRTFALLIFLGA